MAKEEKEGPYELHLKYRPKTLDEVVGQKEAVATLKEMLKNNRVPHSILISGPTGTGKTTIARILKSSLNVSDLDYREVNSADFRGIEVVREIRRGMGLHAITENGNRMYVLDEVHAISKDASNAFLKLLEDTPSHVFFVICTTSAEKLLPTLRNRCTQISTKLLTPKDMMFLLNQILEKEKVEIQEEVLDRVIEVAEGSARLAVNLLNRIYKLKDVDSQLEAVLRSDTKTQAFDLVKLLLWERNVKWVDVANVLKSIEDEPETIRRILLKNVGNEILKGNKNSNRAAVLAVAFERPYYDSGMCGLITSCWEVFNSK